MEDNLENSANRSVDSDNSRKSFNLRGQDEEFKARHDAVFGNLPITKLNTNTDETVERGSQEQAEEEENMKDYKGEESIFKKPMPKLPVPSQKPRREFTSRKSSVPDYKKNPQKWTKYNLASVSDMSEKSNTAAAMQFLREMEDRKNTETGMNEETDGKIIFKKPKTKDIRKNDSQVGMFKDGKRCMPAFEFGDKKSPKVKEKAVKKMKLAQKQMSLDHLDEDEEDN